MASYSAWITTFQSSSIMINKIGFHFCWTIFYQNFTRVAPYIVRKWSLTDLIGAFEWRSRYSYIALKEHWRDTSSVFDHYRIAANRRTARRSRLYTACRSYTSQIFNIETLMSFFAKRYIIINKIFCDFFTEKERLHRQRIKNLFI